MRAMLLSFLLSTPVLAGITTDGSVGSAETLTGPDFEIPAQLGTRAGDNLFHSFQQFDLMQGESATFSGPADLQRVVGRVTGGSVSSLDGVLRSTIAGADLYLFNPAGMVFGPNAQLALSGGFYAAAADGLQFSDGTAFSADLATPSQFSTASPSAFGLLGGSLAVDGAELTVTTGETLSLAGDSVKLNNASLAVPSGRLEIRAVSAAAPQDTGGDVVVQNSLISTSGRPSGTIHIRGGRFELHNSTVSAENYSGDAGGISVQAAEIALTNGSTIASSNYGAGAGGQIDLQATGTVSLRGENPLGRGSRIAVDAFGSGADAGSGGSVRIQGARVELADGAIVSGSTVGAGQGGQIQLIADQDITLSGTTQSGQGTVISTTAQGAGNAGQARLTAHSVALSDGAQIVANSQGAGQGGDIAITSNGALTIAGETPAGSLSQLASNSSGTGDAGQIQLSVGNLTLDQGGRIFSATFGAGQGGTVQAEVANDTVIRGTSPTNPLSLSGIYLGSYGNGPGNAGTLNLTSGNLELRDGGVITADTYGSGRGGDITLTIADTTQLHGQTAEGTGSFITTLTTLPEATGNGGDFTLTTGSLEIADGAQIAAATLGRGNGGDVVITARKNIEIHGQDEAGFVSGVFSSAENTATGNAGRITIHADALDLHDQGQIAVDSHGPGQGGDMFLTANQVQVRDQGKLLAGSRDVGDAGNITVQSQRFVVANQGSVQANTTGPGKGGDIRVTTDRMLLRNGGEVLADSQGTGKAGNIEIQVKERMFIVESAVKTATTEADGGDIAIGGDGFIHLVRGDIETKVQAKDGNGGNITFTPEFVVLNGGRIIASAIGGNGGNIQITTTGRYDLAPSVIDASSRFGIDGVVAVNSPAVDVTTGLIAPPTDLASEQQLTNQCAANARHGASRFFRARSGAVPLSPEDWQTGSLSGL